MYPRLAIGGGRQISNDRVDVGPALSQKQVAKRHLSCWQAAKDLSSGENDNSAEKFAAEQPRAWLSDGSERDARTSLWTG